MDKELSFTIKEGGTVGPTIGEGERLIRELVDKRKSIWKEKGSLVADRAVCRDNADIILDTPILRETVTRKPYLLIECCFSLVNKQKRDAPFFFNRVQRDFIERLAAHGTKRPFFILKGRQQGFTTLITAIQLSFAIVRRNFSGFTVADRDDNVKTIFLDKAKVIYSRLPKRLKPSEGLNSQSELFFSKLNSSWRVACATENIGRSRTLSFIHYSEVSFFKCSLSALQRSIQESLVPDAICIYETTARGYGEVGNASFSILCEDMEDKAIYTLSFSSGDYSGNFSVSVYGSSPVNVVKNGRTSVSFMYDSSKFGGAIPVCDSVRTAPVAELFSFTIVKGSGSEYIPLAGSADRISISSCGKNLLDPLVLASAPVEGGESSLHGDSITIAASGSYCYTSTYYSPLKILVKPNEVITFSWSTDSADALGSVHIFGNGETSSMVYAPSNAGKLSYTVPEGISFVTYRIGVNGIGNTLTYSRMQVERSRDATPYEPYRKGDSLSLGIGEKGYITPISPVMNVYTTDDIALCRGEFLKSSTVSDAMGLMHTEDEDFITSVQAEYSSSGGKLLLHLSSGDGATRTVDVTDAFRAFITNELSGGV